MPGFAEGGGKWEHTGHDTQWFLGHISHISYMDLVLQDGVDETEGSFLPSDR